MLQVNKTDADYEGVTIKPKPPIELAEAPVIDAVQETPIQAREKLARLSVEEASNFNPDETASNLKIAKDLGVPLEWVDSDVEEMTRRWKASGLDASQIGVDTPGTLKFLSKMDNARIAHDDLSMVGGFERTIRQVGAGYREQAAGVRLGNLATKEDNGEDLSIAEKAELLALRSGVYDDKKDPESVSDKITYGLGSFAGQIKENPIPTVAGAATLLLTKNPLAATGAAQLATLATTFGIERGGFLEEAKNLTDADGKPLDKGAIQGASYVVGSLNALLETAEVGSLAKAAGVGQMLKTQRQALAKGVMEKLIKSPAGIAALKWFGRSAVGIGEQAIQEAAQETVSVISEKSIGANTSGSVGRVGKAFEMAAFQSLIPTAGFASVKIQSDWRESNQAKITYEKLQEQAKAAQETKVAQRSPEAMTALAQDILTSNGQGDGQIYISREKFLEVAQKLKLDIPTISANLKIDAQLNTNSEDLIIPHANYIGYVMANKELSEEFNKVIRTTPEGISYEEGVELGKKVEGQITKVIEQGYESAKEGVSQDQKESLMIEQRVKDQLKKTKVVKGTEGAYATSVRLMYETISQKAGISPGELFNKVGFKVTHEFDSSRTGKIQRGTILLKDGQESEIILNDLSDPTTFLHEIGHQALHVIQTLGQQKNVTPEIQELVTAANELLGKDITKEKLTSADWEKHAQSYERYLQNGKAPNQRLQGLFETLGGFMSKVYGNLPAYGIDLNSEVATTFAPLFTLESTVDAVAQTLDSQPMFKSAAEAKMTERQYAQYLNLYKAAAEKAKKRIYQIVKRDLVGSRIGDYRNNRKQIVEKVKMLPGARLRYWLETGVIRYEENGEVVEKIQVKGKGNEIVLSDAKKQESGMDEAGNIIYKRPAKAISYGIDPKELDLLLESGTITKEQHRALSRYAKDGAPSLERLAGSYGYPDEATLIEDLSDEPTHAGYVKNQTAKVMQQEYEDLLNSQAIEQLALEALQNDEKYLSLKQEMEAIAKLSGEQEVNFTVIEAEVKEEVENTPWNQLKPYLHLRAALRTAAQAATLKQRKSFKEAFAKKLAHVRSFLTYKAQEEARMRSLKAVRYLKGVSDRKEKIFLVSQGQYWERIDEILSTIDLGKRTLKDIQGARTTLREWAELRAAEGDAIVIPDSVLEASKVASYKELSVAVLEDVVTAVKTIEESAKKTQEFEKQQALDSRTSLAAKMIAEAEPFAKNKKAVEESDATKNWSEDLMDGFGTLWSSLQQLGRLAQFMSLFDSKGTFQKFYENLRDKSVAAEKYAFDNFQKLKSIFGYGKESYFNQKISIRRDNGTVYQLKRRDVIELALYLGSEEGQVYWYRSNKFSMRETQALLDQLSAKDVAAINDVFALTKESEPMVFEDSKRLGIDLKKVKPTSYSVKNGNITGGYYPLNLRKVNGDENARSVKDQVASLFMSTKSFSPQAALKGYMHSRVGSKQHKLKFTGLFNTLVNHFQEVGTQHFLYEDARTAYKVLQIPELKAQMERTIGKANTKLWTWWLAEIYGQNQSTSATAAEGIVEKALSYVRQKTIVGMLAFNATTVLSQFTSLPLVFTEVKPKFVFGTLGLFAKKLSNGTLSDFACKILQKDPALFLRKEGGGSQDVYEVRTAFEGVTSQASSALLGTTDFATALISWQSAYTQAIAPVKEGGLGMTEQEAISYARSVVERTQSTPLKSGQAQALRGGIIMRLTTMFYNFMNTALGILSTGVRKVQVKGSSEMPALIGSVFAVVILQGLAMALVSGRSRSKEAKEDPAMFLAQEFGSQVSGMFPVVRDFWSSMEYGRDYQISPAVSPIVDIAKAIPGSLRDIQRQQLSKETLRGILWASALIGRADIPVIQLSRVYGTAKRQADGYDVDILDYLSGYKER